MDPRPWVARLREKLEAPAVRESLRGTRAQLGLPPDGLPWDASIADEYEIAWLRIYSKRDGIQFYRGDKPFDPFAARTRFSEEQVRQLREAAWELASYLGVSLLNLDFVELEQLILFDTPRDDFAERHAVGYGLISGGGTVWSVFDVYRLYRACQ